MRNIQRFSARAFVCVIGALLVFLGAATQSKSSRLSLSNDRIGIDDAVTVTLSGGRVPQHDADWIGLYEAGETPDGDPPSIWWKTLPELGIRGGSGSFRFDPASIAPERRRRYTEGNSYKFIFAYDDSYTIEATVNFTIVPADPVEFAAANDGAGWIVVFPLAGVEGLDYYANDRFDHNPATCFPRSLSAAAFNGLLRTQSANENGRNALLNSYRQNGSEYRIVPEVDTLDQYLLREIFPANGYQLDRYLESVVTDYAGGHTGYDGHIGNDYCVFSFDMINAGIPVYAVASGTVSAVVDGNPDQNEPGSSNEVFIDHGSGRTSYYAHLMRGSPVQVGQRVRAGQVIGALGSSGGQGPHLHFGIMESGVWLDPFAGPDSPGASRFREQPPYSPSEPTLVAFQGIRDVSQSTSSWSRPANARAWRIGDNDFAFSVDFTRVRRGDSASARVLGPNGRVHWISSGDWQTFGADEGAWTVRSYDMDWIAPTPGEWTMEVSVAGRLVLRAPFTVVAAGAPLPAMPVPRAPVGASLLLLTGTNRVYRCLVSTGPDAADPYGERVRWRYQWTVDGRTIRDVTICSRGDYARAPAEGRMACRVSVVGSAGESAAVIAHTSDQAEIDPDFNSSNLNRLAGRGSRFQTLD